MPSLTLLLEKALLKTRHRPVRFSGDRLGTAVYRMRKPAAVLLVSAVFCGAFFSFQNEFRFTEPGASVRTEAGQVSELFGSSNPLVLLLPGDESDESYDTQRGLVRDLASLRRADGSPVVRDITAMVTTGAAALKEYSAADVAEMTGMSPAAVSLFFLVNGFGNSVRADRLLAAADSVAGGNPQVAELQKQLAAARNVFVGDHYHRIVMEPAFSATDRDFSTCMDTVLTSGIILVTAGYVIGKLCSIYYISSIGLLISRGALLSVLLVLTLLPALLALSDRWIIRRG